MDNFKIVLKNALKGILKMKSVKISLVLVLILAVLLPSFVYYITIDDGTYKEGDWSSTPYAVSTYTSNVKVGEDGITSETTAQDLWDEMIRNGSNVEDYLDSPEELEKLMNAEIITQYPKIGNPDAKLDGIIEFERHKTDGTSCKLKYLDSETFNSYIDANDTTAMNYFTLDEEGNALVAVTDKTTETLTSNDPEMDIGEYTDTLDDSNKSDGKYEKVEINVSSKPIYFKNVVSKYIMPFQYLWSLLVISDDKDFVLELADLVEDSEITISIYDNITTTVNTDEYEYKKERRTDTHVIVKPDYGIRDFPAERYWVAEDNENYDPNYPADYSTDETQYKITHVIKYENNMPVVDLTKANVWIVDYSKEYTYQANKQTSENSNSKDEEDTEYVEDEGSPEDSVDNIALLKNGHATDYAKIYENLAQQIENSKAASQDVGEGEEGEEDAIEPVDVKINVSYVKLNHYTHKIKRKQTNTSTVSAQKYVSGAVINNPKVEKDKEEVNFVTILCKASHIEARKKITSEIPSWLFELLETNPDTANMVDLTKYLIYKVNGKNYGVTEYDFSVYSNNNFSNATGAIYGNSIQEKVWFMLKDLGYSDISAAGAMGNIHYESGSFDPTSIEDGYTETTGGIGICQWTNNKRGATGRNTSLRNYAASKGTTWQDETIQVEFLRGELTKGGGADGYAAYQLMTTTSLYGSALACASAWENATTVEDATKAFCYSFERPGKQYAQSSMSTRISYAQQYYDMYSGMEAPQEINTTLTGDNKTKMQSMISEAIRIANDDTYKYSQDFRESQYYYDCSSFVSRLYTQYFGISRLDSGSAGRGTDNIRANCKSQYMQVSMNSLQPGDILWRDGHVALYIGNNQTAEAASTKSGIVVRTMGTYTEAFRIIK